jgi:hypothetical protein
MFFTRVDQRCWVGSHAEGALNPERVASNLCPSSIPHVSFVEGDVVAQSKEP